MIYVIGLGQNAGDLSVNGQKRISACDLIVVKTAFSPTYTYFVDNGIKHVTLDDIYKKSKDFDSLNANIYKFLKSKETKFSNIAYCVDGSGYDDKSVFYIYQNDISIRIFEARSKGASIFATSTVRYSADDVLDGKFIPSDLPLSIYEVDTKSTATRLKEKLLEYMDDNTTILFANSKEKSTIKLGELDKQFSFNSSTRISFDPQPLATKKKFNYYDLISILKILRKDCPWDNAQTNKTLRMDVLMEAYEVVDAIDSEDDDKLLTELGELLLQAVFHSIIAEDRKAFTNSDILSSVCRSLIFKHQHIFLGGQASDAPEGLSGRMEKGQQDTVLKEIRAIPKTYPALLRALKVQKKANKIGFEICQKFMNFTRIQSKLEELKNTPPTEYDKLELLIGELFFLIVNIVRQYDIEPELALNAATENFIKDFAKFEGLLYNQR